jgi:hypothetical protein
MRGEGKNKKPQQLQISARMQNWDGEVIERCGLYQWTFLRLNLKIKNTVNSYKIVVHPLAQLVTT